MESAVYYISELPKLPVPNDLFDVRFIHSENMTVAFNVLKKGAIVPEHAHLHETIDYVLEGRLDLKIGEHTTRMEAGTVARVPSHIPHSAYAVTDCRVVNIFYPAREDFKEG
jgi:quercetin dioxygenase-like cupin family protein